MTAIWSCTHKPYILLLVAILICPCVSTGKDESDHSAPALVIGWEDPFQCAEGASVFFGCETLHLDPTGSERLIMWMVSGEESNTQMLVELGSPPFESIKLQRLYVGDFELHCSLNHPSGEEIVHAHRTLTILEGNISNVRATLDREQCTYEVFQPVIDALGWTHSGDGMGGLGLAGQAGLKFYTHIAYRKKFKALLQAVVANRGGRGVFFIEVGANDGVFVDPLRDWIMRGGWTGILIEPLKDLFDKLVENYMGVDGLIFENVAVAEIGDGETTTMTMTRVPAHVVEQCAADKTDCRYASGLGSLVFHDRQGHPMLAKEGIQEEVRVATLQQILQRNNVERIDVLQIDAEGYDGQILLSLDLERYRPLLIQIEIEWLQPEVLRTLVQRLSRAGYELMTFGGDLTAYLPGLITSL